MPDMAMCVQSLCPKSGECYRHEATPNEHWQSYIDFQFTTDGCEHFLPLYTHITTTDTIKENE